MENLGWELLPHPVPSLWLSAAESEPPSGCVVSL